MSKTVIFDFDGTLANTIDLAVRIYNEHADDFKSDKVDKKEFPKLRKLGYKKGLKEKNIKWYELPKIALTVTREMKLQMDEVKPYPGIVKVLNDLQGGGISIGVLTSNNASLVQDFFTMNNFPVFDFVVSEKTMFGKDKALKRIMKRHELDNKNVIYVGDEPRDVTASHKANVKVIGVSWGLAGEEWLKTTNPDALVHTTEELKKTILAM